MITRYQIIMPTGTIAESVIDWPEEPGFNLFQKLLDPIFNDWFEHVSVLGEDLHSPRDMFVDESGLLKHLPVNPRATEIYWRAAIKRGIQPDVGIAGPAVYFPERRVWF